MVTKSDPDDLNAIKNEVFQLIVAYDNGICEADLSKTMVSVSSENRMYAINALANEGKIQLCKRGSDLIYRAVDSKTTANHSALQNHSNISPEERAVYRVVESAGSKGIWNREIRNQTKIPLNQMSKVLKNLETKKLIKAVKSVTASKRKLYMLYGLEPDKSVTGGAWYSGTEFESEYVEVLYDRCYNFVKSRLVAVDEQRDFVEASKQSLVSSSDVKEYIDKSKISTVELTLQDIEMVLETIVFDGKIEKVTVEKKPDPVQVPVKGDKNLTSDEEDVEMTNVTYFYRALAQLVESSGVMRTPCGQCPYIHECRPGAIISPDKCVYLERWFST